MTAPFQRVGMVETGKSSVRNGPLSQRSEPVKVVGAFDCRRYPAPFQRGKEIRRAALVKIGVREVGWHRGITSVP